MIGVGQYCPAPSSPHVDAAMKPDCRSAYACSRLHVRSRAWQGQSLVLFFPRVLLPVHRPEAAVEKGVSCNLQGTEEHKPQSEKEPMQPASIVRSD